LLLIVSRRFCCRQTYGSRKVKTPRGYMQGYNAQAVTTAQQIVVAAEVTVTSSDSTHLAPMITAAARSCTLPGLSRQTSSSPTWATGTVRISSSS
jgi:hypothetical protein